MANILVTGGAGFIGSHVIDELIAKKHTVIAIDNLSGGFKENINPLAQFIEMDILDEIELEKVFKNYSIEYIYHLAAYAAEGLSHFIRKFNYTNNVIGSINLINLAVKYNVKCFTFTSSIAVYGKNQLPYSEETVPSPEDPYGIGKYTIELDLKCAYEMFGLNYIVFRPHNVYGERQNIGDKYRNVVGIFMNNILMKKPLPIFGDGLQSRSFSYVEDIVLPIVNAAFLPKTYGQVYNIGNDDVTSVKDLANLVAKTFNVDPILEYHEQRKEVVHAQSQHTKAKLAFGELIKSTKLKDGLTKMALWVKQHGPRDLVKFKRIEIKRNLPESWK